MNFAYFTFLGLTGYCFYAYHAKADTIQYFPVEPSLDDPASPGESYPSFVNIMRTAPRRDILDPYMREGVYVFLCFIVAFVEEIYADLKPHFDRNRQLPQIQAEEP